MEAAGALRDYPEGTLAEELPTECWSSWLYDDNVTWGLFVMAAGIEYSTSDFTPWQRHHFVVLCSTCERRCTFD